MYYLSVFIHVLSAIFWIGGMLFTVSVLVPAARHKILADSRGAFFELIGRKFSKISWILFLVLLVTGITNLLGRGYILQDLVDPYFWSTPFGEQLVIKLILFASVLIISGVHDFYAGPKAAMLMQTEPESPQTKKFRKLSSWIGRLNFLLGLLILYYAIRLTRG
jgi:uncharacterized membrane protein